MSASAILKLQTAGFTVEQVTALAELIDSQAASKSDLEGTEHRLDTRIGEVENRLDARISGVEHRLGAKIGQLGSDLKTLEVKIDGRILLLQWMMGFVLALLVAIFGKLFLH